MCRACFSDFLNLSGGMWGGQRDPPAWTRNFARQQKALRKALAAKANADVLALPAPGDDEESGENLMFALVLEMLLLVLLCHVYREALSAKEDCKRAGAAGAG